MHAESGEEIHAKYTKGRTREGRGVNKSRRARGITQREWRRITQSVQRKMHAEGAELRNRRGRWERRMRSDDRLRNVSLLCAQILR